MKKRNIIIVSVISLILIIIIISLVIINSNLTNENKKDNKDIIIEENNKDNKENEYNEIDEFYSDIKEYVDIRDLDELYNSTDAQKDNCFVIGAMVHNDYLYGEFMENYRNKKAAFIRVVQNTIEGDAVIYDVKYIPSVDKIYIITDTTRDKYSNDNDRKIELIIYEKIGEIEDNNHLYWVAYNGNIDMSKEALTTNNTFIIATIN